MDKIDRMIAHRKNLIQQIRGLDAALAHLGAPMQFPVLSHTPVNLPELIDAQKRRWAERRKNQGKNVDIFITAIKKRDVINSQAT